MIVRLQGLPFDARSPSHFRLMPPFAAPDSVLDISYLESGRWLLYLDHNGVVVYKTFTRRDDAVRLVAQAFRGELARGT